MTQYIWQSEQWPNFAWDTSVLLAPLSECRLKQGKLLAKMASLGFNNEQQAYMDVLLEEAMTTAAIEGESLNRDSVRSSIARRLGLPSAGLPVDRYTDGLIDVLMDATQKCSNELTEERLFGWHAALFPTGYSGLQQIDVAKWRGDYPMKVVSGRLGHEKVHYEAVPYEQVDAEMKRFIQWWNKDEPQLDGLIRAAMAHFWFITIHPFEDGNGRLARALTDMALAADDKQPMRYYSLSSQINAEREAYYDILETSQKGDVDITKWLLWFLGCVSRGIDSSEQRMALVLDKASFWVRHAQTQISDRQRKVINKLLDAGKGGYVGGLTNRKFAAITGVSRQTATRELEYLVKAGVIKQNPGEGRSVNYDLAWG